ncbi:hypothetical protein B0T09DRAFT_396477 [Sordaria sp. MPI-SDFR-AT-0083]|nr:hypothetical protein B0T09DRAFT_396477 [Sordaria sp. MPI-SDFR-AT-0083]
MNKRLSKLFNMSTSTSPSKSFTLLEFLPAELRDRIWEHVVDPFRVLRITLYQSGFPPTAQFLGSFLYGPPWHVKVGSTPNLREATRHVRNLLLVSKAVYKDIKLRILPDLLFVTVDWDAPYSTIPNSGRGEVVYSIPWNRKTERICLEMVHLNWQKKDRVRLVDWGNREEIQRTGNGLPDPPVWVNETGYEPFGQDDGDDDDAAESDPDESRNPSRPSKFYLPPASLLVDQDQNPRPPDAAVAFRYKPDPKALGEIYIPYSQVRTLCQRQISLVPTTPILGDEHQVQQQVQQEAHYNSSNPAPPPSQDPPRHQHNPHRRRLHPE